MNSHIKSLHHVLQAVASKMITSEIVQNRISEFEELIGTSNDSVVRLYVQVYDRTHKDWNKLFGTGMSQ